MLTRGGRRPPKFVLVDLSFSVLVNREPSTVNGSSVFDIGCPLCYLIAMKVAWEGKVYELEKPLTVGQLLERFSLNPEAHIVVANEKLVTEDCKLSLEDNIRIVRVISGG
jgi:sulfur carrier protein ThiS